MRLKTYAKHSHITMSKLSANFRICVHFIVANEEIASSFRPHYWEYSHIHKCGLFAAEKVAYFPRMRPSKFRIMRIFRICKETLADEN